MKALTLYLLLLLWPAVGLMAGSHQDPARHRERTLRRLTHRLGLDGRQRDAVRAVLESAGGDPSVRPLTAEAGEKIAELLTPHQKRLFEGSPEGKNYVNEKYGICCPPKPRPR